MVFFVLMNVLEIGYGTSLSSAVLSGGEIFADPDTNYFSMDLPRDSQRIRPEHLDQMRATEAHWAALPYRDGAFGAVIMRSCFGQFTDTPQVWLSERWSLDFAINEVARVLEPGGELFVSEENTPEDLKQVVPDIVRAGLDIEIFEREIDPTTGEPNPAYVTLRNQYYGDRLRGLSGGRRLNGRYVLAATKPEVRSFVTNTVEAGRILRYRTDYRGDWSEVKDDTKLGRYLPADHDSLELELRVAKTMVALAGDRYTYWVDQLEAEMQ